MLYMVSTPSPHTKESIKASLECTRNNIIIHLYVYILVGCKHRASEGVFYIEGHGFVCQINEQVTFAHL